MDDKGRTRPKSSYKSLITIMTKTKKKAIKDKLFKILHIICYVLSAIFVLTLFIGFLQSCKNKTNNNSQNLENSALKLPIQNNSQALFSPIQSDDFTLTQDVVIKLYDFVGVNYYDYTYNDYDGFVVSYPVEVYTNQLRYVSENTKTTLEFHFVALEDSGHFVIRLSEIYLNDYLMIEKQDSLPWLNDYTVGSSLYEDYVFIYLKGENDLISPFYGQKPFKSFTFNEQINYNAPMGLNLSAFYGSTAIWTHTASDTAYIDYDVGLFYSNGQYFNKIRYWCNTTNGLSYDYDTGIQDAPAGYYSYWMLTYINTYLNTEVPVNVRNVGTYYKNNAYGYYQQNGSTWQSVNFRFLNFVDIDENTLNKLETYNNNNQIIVTGGSINGGGASVFDVLGVAFTSVNALWSIMILPNISLGVLMFLPLVVFIIFLVIKVMKK